MTDNEKRVSARDVCLRKVQLHLMASPPRIPLAILAIQRYGNSLEITADTLPGFAQDTPIVDERLQLNQRQINALEKYGIIFLGQLLAKAPQWLESIPYFETRDLLKKLEKHKLSFGTALPKSAQTRSEY